QRSSNCAAVSALAEEEGMLELQNGRLLASISQGTPAPDSNRSGCTGIKHQASPVNPAKLHPQPRKGKLADTCAIGRPPRTKRRSLLSNNRRSPVKLNLGGRGMIGLSVQIPLGHYTHC